MTPITLGFLVVFAPYIRAHNRPFFVMFHPGSISTTIECPVYGTILRRHVFPFACNSRFTLVENLYDNGIPVFTVCATVLTGVVSVPTYLAVVGCIIIWVDEVFLTSDQIPNQILDVTTRIKHTETMSGYN